VHILPNGTRQQQALQRYKEALELQWDYYGPFGFAAVLSDIGEPMYDLNMKVTADLLMQKEIAIVGSAEQVIEKIMRIKQTCNYEDFLFTAWFEAGGYRSEEIEDQMQLFASEVMPVLRRECGGAPTLPESTVQLVPEQALAGAIASS
jgi:hypothetical protein